MPRNRVIYQSEALYVSEKINSTGVGKHHQLERVQSANYNFSVNRQDINEFGSLARIDSVVMEAPTVGLDFSYYLTDGMNERALGFFVQTGTTGAGAISGQFTSGHMVQDSGQNFFITTVPEGSDAVGTTDGTGVTAIGLGNAFLTDYTLDLAVGSLPTVSVSMECANINSDIGISSPDDGLGGITLPSVSVTDGTKIAGSVVLPASTTGESTISALRPGDVTVDISNLNGETIAKLGNGTEIDAAHVQSASLSVPMSRTPIQRLGTRFAYARTVDFPLVSTLSVNAILNDVTAANLADIIDLNSTNDVTITVKDKDGVNAMLYKLKGCKIDSESFSSSIGSDKTVDLTFSTQIGGVNDTNNGVFVSGANKTIVYS